MMAEDYQLALFREIFEVLQMLGNAVHGDQFRACDGGSGMFHRFADIDQLQGFAGIELAFDFRGHNFEWFHCRKRIA
jgi:hypothetical protein